MTRERRSSFDGSEAARAARELPLLLGASGGAPESLLLIGAPDAEGVVHVRVWSAGDWSAPPKARAERAAAFLQWLESQSAAGRSMNQSLYALRLWLRGESTAPR
ncbi:MAG TPA: hypothetical protein VFP90_14580 [Gemmatimonadaceae bacterium]|nr:hypothetical protein [Gemmatimonadaceae bacterium]